MNKSLFLFFILFNLQVLSESQKNDEESNFAYSENIYPYKVRNLYALITNEQALSNAIEQKDIEKVKYIIKNGVLNLDIKTQNGFTALMTAVLINDEEIVKILLAAGANPDVQETVEFTALMIAAHKNNYQIVSALLDAGANPNMQSENGSTALIGIFYSLDEMRTASGSLIPMKEIIETKEKIISKLLDAGANPDLQDNTGTTALMAACCAIDPCLDIIRLLLDYKANPNIQDRNGNSALMKIALYSSWRSKCRSKEKQETNDIFGQRIQYSEIAKVLLNAGANPNLRTKSLSALEINNNQDPELVQALIDHGAKA